MHIICRCTYQHSSYKPKISSNSVTPPTEGTTRYIYYYYLHLTACLDNWSHKCVIKVIITAWSMHTIHRCTYQYSSYNLKGSSWSVTSPRDGKTRYIYTNYYLHLTACLHNCQVMIAVDAYFSQNDIHTSTLVRSSRILHVYIKKSYLQQKELMEKEGTYIHIQCTCS